VFKKIFAFLFHSDTSRCVFSVSQTNENIYYENGTVRAQLFLLKILLLEGRHVSAPLLGHHQVTKNILRGNYVGGRVTVRDILQRDLVVTFVAKIYNNTYLHYACKL
jgi:hypothetical protein